MSTDDPEAIPRLHAEIRALEWRLKDARTFARQVAGIALAMADDAHRELSNEERAMCRRARTF